MKRKIGFLGSVFVGYWMIFLLQKPCFLFRNRDVWMSMSWSEWFRALGSGMLFDLSMAGYLTVVPLLLTLLTRWVPAKKIEIALRIYFLIASLQIAVVFAFSGALLHSWSAQLLLFIGYATVIMMVYGEWILPLFSKSYAVPVRRPYRQVSKLLVVAFVLLFGGVFGAKCISATERAVTPALYSLKINPYYELMASLYDVRGVEK